MTNVAGKTTSDPATVTVTPPPVADRYLMDFEKTPTNQLTDRIRFRAGVFHEAGNNPKTRTVPVTAQRQLNGRIVSGNFARVVTLYGSKRLTIASPDNNTPTGGRIRLTLANFDPNQGVTLTSLTLSNLTPPGAYLSFYYVDGSSSRQPLGATAAGGSLVVPLDVKNLRTVEIYAPNAYAVDDVRFTDEHDN